MFKKSLIIVAMVCALVCGSVYASDCGTGDFYADGGLVGLAGNGICHVATDPVGAIGTAGEAVVDTTVMMGKGVYVGGATCVDVARNGVIHVATDPVGALSTAGESVVETAAKGICSVWAVAFGK